MENSEEHISLNDRELKIFIYGFIAGLIILGIILFMTGFNFEGQTPPCI